MAAPCRLILVCLLALLALGVPASAGAALPRAGSQLQAHDHYTWGHNWHVQFIVDRKTPRMINTLVIYFEACHSTILKTRLPISPEGVVSFSGTGQGPGSFKIWAAFSAPDTIEGAVELKNKKCDTGVFWFKAMTNGALVRANVHGPTYPDISTANVQQLRQAQAMRRFVWKAARDRFPTLQSALDQGYHVSPTIKWRPMIFHIRNTHYMHDGITFDSQRPEALMYWYEPGIDPILLGAMFRVPKGDRPEFAGPIPIYHQHVGRHVSMPMTHVWLTNNVTTAWANCAPIADLEAALPGFHYANARPLPGGPGVPCP